MRRTNIKQRRRERGRDGRDEGKEMEVNLWTISI